MANANNLGTFCGLTSYSWTVPVAGMYTLEGKISLPTITDGSAANSQAVVTIKQNGSTQYTGLAGQEGFLVELTCALNDVLQVSLSSAAAVDQPINAVKTTLAIY